jgi:hypothetical protein
LFGANVPTGQRSQKILFGIIVPLIALPIGQMGKIFEEKTSTTTK